MLAWQFPCEAMSGQSWLNRLADGEEKTQGDFNLLGQDYPIKHRFI